MAQDNGDILAYFSITFKELILDGTNISKSERKRMDGVSKNAERVRAFLIGQLGKNHNVPENPIHLQDIFDEIYSAALQARELVGGRIIMLECEDDQRLIRHYENHGFRLIVEEGEEQPSLRTMYTHITEEE